MSLTRGEALAGRKLEKETRAGVPHFTPGQHQARRLTASECLLTFVDPMGHLCIVPCEKLEDGTWNHREMVIRTGMYFAEVRPLPGTYSLTKESEAAIKEAYKAKGKKKPAPDESGTGSYAE